MPEPRTITEAAEFIRTGELTPTDLLEQCLARIERYEPRVRAWAYIDCAAAREQAAQLSTELKNGQHRGPLHGIPLGIKDIIDVFDMPTGCGSKRWAQSFARRDATCVERLRQAGAVIVGKTVTTAYASFDPPVTRNPWNLDLTPGGSSSGSAAAVACGMCLGALATQTGGSITRPASYCGVYSLKPTHGRVSVDGVLPLAPSLDHIGMMANSVRDLALLFNATAGADTRSPETLARIVPDPFGNRYDMPRDPDMGYEHNWLCVTDDFFPPRCTEPMRTAFDTMVRTLVRYEPTDEMIGRVHSVSLPPGFAEAPERQLTVMAVEAAAYHEPRYRRHPDDYPPKITSLIERGLRTSAAEYARCKQFQARFTDELRTRFRVLLVPATPAPAPPAETTGDPTFNSPWSYTGMPVLSLPFSWTADGLPLAAQVVAKQGQEDDLFRTAAWVERVIGFAPRPLSL
ncbi:amidase [Frigoriglobus tundricola]|uniref:Glutamyl-tRNA(Gln) amidotransferase subunit A-like protein n=1 Tax=Frigoriglobus tundricola TaxID=2774151 RepID=A0A6M5YZ21_9BACT|nr:amidase [Frigoriglobus tundricola]QJW99377.1 Glutamyl-tRNA(Gln) amidotransferase subunit A-like protein [Frigoriglobus tundricola]